MSGLGKYIVIDSHSINHVFMKNTHLDINGAIFHMHCAYMSDVYKTVNDCLMIIMRPKKNL